MSAVKVSSIIPCFNAAAFVAQAVQNALDRTYSLIEVVVVDDSSINGCPSLTHRGAVPCRTCV